MGGYVEEELRNAARSLAERDPSYAQKALESDTVVDRLQLTVDEQCLKILALHQPVAGDLRFITATIKIANDLERIGDLAGNLAKRALLLVKEAPFDAPIDIERMVEIASGMLRDSLDSLVRGDAAMARSVCDRDDEVDILHRTQIKQLLEHMKAHPDSIEQCEALISSSRCIERIADLATNIAEDVVFLVEAIDIRHPGIQRQG